MSRLSRGEDKPSNEPTPGLLGTMAGGAAVSCPGMKWRGRWREDGMLTLEQDCQYWLRYLSQQCTLHGKSSRHDASV